MTKKRITRKQAVNAACSSVWEVDIVERHVPYPPPGMMLGRARVAKAGRDIPANGSNNKGRVGHRRWQPPQTVNMEDMLDCMSIDAADHYYHPSAIRYDKGNWVKTEKLIGTDNTHCRPNSKIRSLGAILNPACYHTGYIPKPTVAIDDWEITFPRGHYRSDHKRVVFRVGYDRSVVGRDYLEAFPETVPVITCE